MMRIFSINKYAFKIFATAAATAILFTATGCTKEKPKPKSAPAPVITAKVQIKDVPVVIKAIGNVEAYSIVSVKSQINGQLMKVHFREGQEVAKSSLLFTIDPRTFEAALKQAEAALARDTAQLNNARADAKRYEELVKKGYVAQSQYEQYRTNADALEAVVTADHAAVENARVQLSYCYIYSPIAAKTGNYLLHEGNVVKANDETAMVVLHQIQPIYLNFAVPEKYLADIKKFYSSVGLRVFAVPSGENRNPVEGRLVFIDNAVDKTTGTIKLKALFTNTDRRLWPGQFADASLKLSTIKNALTVPSQAVLTGQQGQYVFVIKPDMTAEVRTVETSLAHDAEIVVTKGLQPDELVVIDGQIKLVQGTKVVLKSSITPSAGEDK
ncbi:MAG: efflux RND transporter periplasmic adaptor subunit [Dissulfurispiraceae bacterium]|jgi:multidrug efflux system membrane fusion protein|nr:efflux RND transporter periplasmic adaptor subunit [Dissulfurispiraceae bacterium]